MRIRKSNEITFWDYVVEEVENFYFILSRISFFGGEKKTDYLLEDQAGIWDC